MGVWKQVGQSLSGLAKHVIKSVVSEPMEVVKDAVGQKMEQGAQTTQQTAPQTAADPMADLAKAGFKTQEDFQKYQGLSEKKDDIELAQIRGKLVREWGLDTTVEGGMQRARMEFEQKEEQRKKVEEQKEEQEIKEEVTNKSVEEEKEELLPAANTIIIKDLKLDPQELTILKGDTVIWKHEDTWEQEGSTRHYLAAHSNEFRSPILFYGDTFNHTFNKNGTFTYIDIIYKEKASMRGTIIVE